MGYTKHRTKIIQRHCQRGVHKTQDEDKQSRDTVNVGYTKDRTKTNNPETLSTWGTQDTGRRQTIQRHCQRGVHNTQDEDNSETLSTWGAKDTGRRQSRDTVNVGYTRHRTKTIQRHCQCGVHKTQDEDKQSRDTVNVRYTSQRTKTIQRHCQRGVHKTQDEDNPETL